MPTPGKQHGVLVPSLELGEQRVPQLMEGPAEHADRPAGRPARRDELIITVSIGDFLTDTMLGARCGKLGMRICRPCGTGIIKAPRRTDGHDR
jgi:hypothetical protein